MQNGESVKLLSQTYSCCPNKEIHPYFSHPVTEIRVKDPPSEYRLILGGHVSENRSHKGVMKMADLSRVLKCIARAAIGAENQYLSTEQNETSLNFSRIGDIRLLFDTPLKPGAEYDITASYFMVYDKKGTPIFTN